MSEARRCDHITAGGAPCRCEEEAMDRPRPDPAPLTAEERAIIRARGPIVLRYTREDETEAEFVLAHIFVAEAEQLWAALDAAEARLAEYIESRIIADDMLRQTVREIARREALEEAARMCEAHDVADPSGAGFVYQIARRIRALAAPRPTEETTT